MEILSIIPARGGSKGLPRKNIAHLKGEPLISYTIEAAINSKFGNRVVVSTEDAEIAEVSAKYGAEVMERPIDLSWDDSTTISVVNNVLKNLDAQGYLPEVVVLLQPTSPLRNSSDIEAAVERFLKGDCDSVISVCEMEHPPFWALKDEKGYLNPIFDKRYISMRRQQLPKAYMPNGALFISSPEAIQRNEGFYTSRTAAYVMPLERSVDVDDEMDLAWAEFLMTRYRALLDLPGPRDSITNGK